MRYLLFIPLLALTARAEDESLMTIHRIETETADRIQARVLDPILGAGQSSVFVKLKLELKREYERSSREGEGQAANIRSKMEVGKSTAPGTMDLEEPLFRSFGFDDPFKFPHHETRGQKQTQESRQIKGVKEERLALSKRYTRFDVVVLLDAKVPAGKLAGVRSALIAIYKPDNIDIKFHSVEFSALK